MTRRLGVLPQDAELGPTHTPFELLQHLGQLQGLGRRQAREATERVLGEVQLHDRMHHRVHSLSHGMRRRVAVASALLGTPELVLLDEPLAGLDPVQARSLRAVLEAHRGRASLVVSSHDLLALERFCDWVVFLDKGRCVRQGPMAEVTGRRRRVEWHTAGAVVPVDALRAALPDHAFVLSGDVLTQEAPTDDALDPSSVIVAGLLAGAGVALREVRRGVSLEATFFDDAGGSAPT